MSAWLLNYSPAINRTQPDCPWYLQKYSVFLLRTSRSPWSLVSLFFQERLQVKVRTTTQTGQLETVQQKKKIYIYIYRKEEKLKELFVPRTSRRKKSERSENPFWNDNGWSIPIVTELGNYRSAPANNAANCQSPRVQRSMISRRSLKVAGFEECETVKKFCTCETPASSNSSIRCKGFS